MPLTRKQKIIENICIQYRPYHEKLSRQRIFIFKFFIGFEGVDILKTSKLGHPVQKILRRIIYLNEYFKRSLSPSTIIKVVVKVVLKYSVVVNTK